MTLVNASLFVQCFSRTGAYSGAWLAPAELLATMEPFTDRGALEYASFHLYLQVPRERASERASERAIAQRDRAHEIARVKRELALLRDIKRS